jgi:hypothetical protein
MEYFTIASLVQSGKWERRVLEREGGDLTRRRRERRGSAEEAQRKRRALCHDDDVVEGDGKPGKRVACDERVILTRSRGDAEEEAEKHQESQSV